MKRLQDNDLVWAYINREFADTLDRPPTQDEAVTAVLVVAALTRLLAEQPPEPYPATIRPRPKPRSF